MGKDGGGGFTGAKRVMQQGQDMSNELYGQAQPINAGLSNMFQQFLGLPQGGREGYYKTVNTPGQQIKNPQYNPGDQRGMFDMGIPEFMQGSGTSNKEWVPGVEGIPGKPWDATASPLWAPGKLATEQAYSTARENMLGNMPAGGGMTAAMGNLERGRANQLVDLQGQIGQDMFNKSINFGMGMPELALGGIGQAGGQLGQLAAAQAQNQTAQQGQKMGKAGDMAMGAGMLMM